jgi:hypothetical protein
MKRIWHQSVFVQHGDEGVPAMDDRAIGEILADWRTAERELEATADEVARPEIEARIVSLRKEHARAVADRESEAQELADWPGRESEPTPA